MIISVYTLQTCKTFGRNRLNIFLNMFSKNKSSVCLNEKFTCRDADQGFKKAFQKIEITLQGKVNITIWEQNRIYKWQQ